MNIFQTDAKNAGFSSDIGAILFFIHLFFSPHYSSNENIQVVQKDTPWKSLDLLLH